MNYIVIKLFADAEDNGYRYNEGDAYPRKGYEPSEERVKALLSKANKRREPLIAEIKEEPKEEKKSKKKGSK